MPHTTNSHTAVVGLAAGCIKPIITVSQTLSNSLAVFDMFIRKARHRICDMPKYNLSRMVWHAHALSMPKTAQNSINYFNEI